MAEERQPEKVILRDDDGAVTHELFLVNGLAEGEVKLYQGGRLQGCLSFHAGRQHGESVFYDMTGRVTLRSSYAHGKLHGDSLHFDQHGKLIRRVAYQHGRLHGQSIDYYPTGKPRETSRYQDDLLDGELIRLNEEGQVTERLQYKQGLPLRTAGAPAHASTKAPSLGATKRRLS
jgi:uncharacterized protein